MNSIAKSEFSTRRLPAQTRYEAWRESIASVFDVEPSIRTDPDSFDASLTSYLMADQIMVSECRTKAQSFERSSLRTTQDGLDHYLIQTHLSGSQEVKRGNRYYEAESGDILVIDLADRHVAETSDFNHLTLVVPRPLLAPYLARPDSQEGRVLKGNNSLTTLAVEHLKMLAQLAGQLNRDAVSLSVTSTMALMASALNGSTRSVESGRAAAAASILSRAKVEIERRLHHCDFSVADMCRTVGLSRAGLYRLFEPYGGVRAYVQERRLRRCAEALLMPGNKERHIYEIAYNWGFVSEAHFSRAFKNQFGLAPREARQFSPSMRKDIHEAMLMEQVGDRQYEVWLAENLRG